jgi:hypothetical protein
LAVRFFGAAVDASAGLSASAARLRRRLAAACSRPRTPVGFGASAASPSASRFGLYSLPTSSIRAMSALSPRRGPTLSRRVYPPGRAWNRGATSAKSLSTILVSAKSSDTWRRAFISFFSASPAAMPRLATVIRRSTNGRSSRAFGTVVSMCSCRRSAVA